MGKANVKQGNFGDIDSFGIGNENNLLKNDYFSSDEKGFFQYP